MRLTTLAGALALTALTLGAAPSFAQERYDRHDQERVRVSSPGSGLSLSLIIGAPRSYRSNEYRPVDGDGTRVPQFSRPTWGAARTLAGRGEQRNGVCRSVRAAHPGRRRHRGRARHVRFLAAV